MPKEIKREQIIQQAIQTMGAESSFEKFSMRHVARDLHIDVSTLYWYFKNKQEILQAMADVIIAEVKFPSSELDWTTQLKQLFGNLFDVYQKYPSSAVLMAGTIPSSSTRLQLIDHAIGIMADAGIEEETANIALTSIDFLLTGLTIDLATESRFRRQIADQKDRGLADQVALIRQRVQDQNLHHMAASVRIRNSLSAKQQFEMGISIIIEGLKSKLS
ncbi:TetR family transcriptional regulator [Secundilactobacillus oryzae JCM 18671]|uniref:TetR family transcriptional regulator n=1 Tax=Secundilactobacillus oryzae JCM 18671 TaxID=1291743 RepID=A0A081BJU3_9LACO|nr:TetR/AcrR family transcriptional regulator C-terminal domain-containing protein [Secundilactobacillus oryzae]GAK48311.1 TetR family transcriptional regulator [Secundilactobacillus oryzae JCM 18671]